MTKLFLILTAIFFFSLNLVFGAYLKDYPTVVLQPDETKIECFATGDEFYNFLHTKDGYVIIQGKDGYYYFATKSGDNLVESNYKVSEINPMETALQKWIMPDKSVITRRISEFNSLKKSQKIGDEPSLQAFKKGVIHNLVIFVTFKEQDEFTEKMSDYEKIYNAEDAVSFRNYYQHASYNQLDVITNFIRSENDAIISIQDQNLRNYYQPYNEQTNPDGYQDNQRYRREKELIKYVLANAKQYVSDSINYDSDNDGNIDNVTFIVKGAPDAWQSLFWPHRSWYSGDEIINGKKVNDYNFMLSDLVFNKSYGLGTLCHEFFHTLGSPDLYHYSYDNFTPTGRWDLMEYTSNPPQFMCNFLKYQYTGWIDNIPEITEEGEYSLNPITSPTGSIYRINSPNSFDDYITLEYRKKEGRYDISVPNSGLLVYRINSTLAYHGNASGPPDEIYLFRPNGEPQNNGTIENANFSKDVNRTSIGDYTNPNIFLSDESASGIEIYDISECGETIRFKVGFKPRTLLISPINLSIDQSLKPVFKWRSIVSAEYYEIQISKNADFSEIIYDELITNDTTFALTENLDFNTNYFARVKWNSSNYQSLWSDILAFSTIPSKPKLIYPSNNFDNVSILPKFAWSKTSSNSTYRMYVSETPDFSKSYIVKMGLTDTTVIVNKALNLNSTYYWKIISYTASGYTIESEISSFTTRNKEVAIINQTKSFDVCKDDSVNLRIFAVGSLAKFQWYFDDVIIAGAVDSILVINSFNQSNIGKYSCEVSCIDTNYSVNSNIITLLMVETPELKNKKFAYKFGEGISATLTAEFDNNLNSFSTAFKLQWLKNNTPLTDGIKYKGATTLTLTILNTDSTDTDSTYMLRLVSICGDTTYTENATILISVNELQNRSKYLNITPNPISDFINIKFSSIANEHAELLLIDLNGSLISKLWSGNIDDTSNEITLDLNKLQINSGVYLVTLKSASTFITQKIVVIE